MAELRTRAGVAKILDGFTWAGAPGPPPRQQSKTAASAGRAFTLNTDEMPQAAGDTAGAGAHPRILNVLGDAAPPPVLDPHEGRALRACGRRLAAMSGGGKQVGRWGPSGAAALALMFPPLGGAGPRPQTTPRGSVFTRMLFGAADRVLPGAAVSFGFGDAGSPCGDWGAPPFPGIHGLPFRAHLRGPTGLKRGKRSNAMFVYSVSSW